MQRRQQSHRTRHTGQSWRVDFGGRRESLPGSLSREKHWQGYRVLTFSRLATGVPTTAVLQEGTAQPSPGLTRMPGPTVQAAAARRC